MEVKMRIEKRVLNDALRVLGKVVCIGRCGLSAMVTVSVLWLRMALRLFLCCWMRLLKQRSTFACRLRQIQCDICISNWCV